MTTRHKWADVIIAFAEGKEIQFRSVHANNPTWLTTTTLTGIENPLLMWRIKPTKKTYWVNVCKTINTKELITCNGIYGSLEKAKTHVSLYLDYVGTYPIEIEE